MKYLGDCSELQLIMEGNAEDERGIQERKKLLLENIRDWTNTDRNVHQARNKDN